MVGVPWLFSLRPVRLLLRLAARPCASQLYGGYSATRGFAEYCVAPADWRSLASPMALTPHCLPNHQARASPPIRASRSRTASRETGSSSAASAAWDTWRCSMPTRWPRVAAVDIADDKLALAKKLGASLTFNAKDVDAVKAVQESIGGAHGVLITAVSKTAFAQGTGMLRRGGTCVLNGLPPGIFRFRSSTWSSAA